MLHIAGQMAGLIGLKFVVDTQGWPGGVIGFKKIKICKEHFFHGQCRALQLVIYKTSILLLQTFINEK